MVNLIKLFLLFLSSTLGYFFIFALVWYNTGHNLTDVSIAVITVLSVAVEALYVFWITDVKTDGD